MVTVLNEYLDKLESIIKKNIPGVLEAEEEAVHDFRVSLKKTRTVMNFIHFWCYNHSEKTKILREFRPVFKRVGRTRELHIHLNLLPELEDKTGFDLSFLVSKINYQLKRNQPPLERDVKVFQKSYPGLYKRIREQINQPEQTKFRPDAPMEFQLRLEKRIKKQLNTDIPDLHRIRRLLKQKVYIFDSFQESELLSFYKEFRSEWKILESSIGQWHDQLVFIHWLQKGLKWKRLTNDQYKTMVRLISQLKKSTRLVEKELIRTIPQINT